MGSQPGRSGQKSAPSGPLLGSTSGEMATSTRHAAVQLLYQVAHAGHEVSVYEATQLYELAKALEVFLVGLGPIGGKLKR